MTSRSFCLRSNSSRVHMLESGSVPQSCEILQTELNSATVAKKTTSPNAATAASKGDYLDVLFLLSF